VPFTATMARFDPQRTPRTLRVLSDDRLSARARRGDRDAFAELYRRYHQRIYRYSLSLLRRPEDAADALQATMSKALTALEDEEPVERVRPWLFRIAHNEAVSLLRVRRTHVELDDLAQADMPRSPDAPSESARREELAQLVTDVHGLPARQQSALVMRELSGLSYEEIAGALETSALASRQLVHQARSALHDQAKGRAMECETVRQAVGEADGRTPRSRPVKAHLVECDGCRRFQHGLRSRGTGLSAFAPPLAPAAASEILRRLLESGSSPATAVVAGGGVVGGVAKVVGASTGKLAAAVATAAVVAGGAGVVGGALVGGGPDRAEPSSQDTATALEPGVRRLRPFGEIARAERRARRERAPVRKRRVQVAAPASDVGLAAVAPPVGPVVEVPTQTARGAEAAVASPHGADSSTKAPAEPRSGGDRRADLSDPAPRSKLPVDPPRLDLPRARTAPKVRVPAVEVPTVSTPTVETPGVGVPPIEVPPVDVPGTPPADPTTPPVDPSSVTSPSVPPSLPSVGGAPPTG